MLAAGDVDALLTARTPSTFDGKTVQRLFPNYVDVERAYYEKTGFFPIMHTVGIRRDVYEEHPWVAPELVKAFTEAKNRAIESIQDSSVLRACLPWLHEEVDRSRETMGDNWWPYGVENNRAELETMTRFSAEQGLSERRLDVDELFAPNTYEDFQI
jgi:4,5-dihydroxyphthalate decarboxylase